ncbi:MAG: ACT domain-containing protein [Eubacteriales bacterium]|jgi:hypothetical protein|nr:ACT domain-containing protein [Eubacteriales bacterium]
MLIKQISIFVQNKSGRLAEITRLLGEKGVNILALSIADTTDFGILRLIVSNPDAAEQAISEYGLTAKVTEVIGVAVPHVPGGLASALAILNDKGISIEYMYAFVTKSEGDAMVILKVDDNFTAMKVLSENGIKLLTPEDVASI